MEYSVLWAKTFLRGVGLSSSNQASSSSTSASPQSTASWSELAQTSIEQSSWLLWETISGTASRSSSPSSSTTSTSTSPFPSLVDQCWSLFSTAANLPLLLTMGNQTQEACACGTQSASHVIIPHVGEVPLDVFAFVFTAMSISVVCWIRVGLRSLRQYYRQHCSNCNNRKKDSDTNANQDEYRKKYQQLKDKGEYKDQSLYEFIETCQTQRRQLRSLPQDPETLRKEKLERIKLESANKPKGPLQLSPARLQNLRQDLRQAPTTKAETAPLVKEAPMYVLPKASRTSSNDENTSSRRQPQ
jgi:hypothetical protein